MHFYKISQFWLLLFMVFLMLVLKWAQRRKKDQISRFANRETFKRLIPSYNHSYPTIQKALYYAILLLVILALAQPQWGKEKTTSTRKGVDILFLLDTSKSMNATDISPNRITKAKNSIKLMLSKIDRQHRLGLIAFAAQSYLACPLTVDYGTFRLFLDAIDTDYIPIQGTSLYNALQSAIAAFGDTEKKYAVIIILSDGEDHLGGMPDILTTLRTLGIRVFCIGVGTKDGAPIPVSQDSISDNKTSDYMTDTQKNMILTRLVDHWLVKIAQDTGGSYYQSTYANNEIDLIIEHIDKLEKREFKDVLVVQKQDRFQIFLIVTFIVLVAELLLSQEKKK
jgi:Ca-activated chloride channel homolog